MITDAELAALCASVYPPAVRSGRSQGNPRHRARSPDLHPARLSSDQMDRHRRPRRYASSNIPPTPCRRHRNTRHDDTLGLGRKFRREIRSRQLARRWANVSDQIKNEISRLDNVHAVYLTGHSLGGALAYLWSTRLLRYAFRRARNVWRSSRVSPRLEQALLLSGVTARRYEVAGDPIPWIPRGRWRSYGVRHMLRGANLVAIAAQSHNQPLHERKPSARELKALATASFCSFSDSTKPPKSRTIAVFPCLWP